MNRNFQSLNGLEIGSKTEYDLGKSADIICGEADAVGMIYREGNKTYLTFEGGEGTIREARSPHLRGKKFLVAESDANNEVKFDSSEIFLPINK